MMEFINELTEARMYRGSETLSGKSAKEIGEIVFMMFLVLEILRVEDARFAIAYVSNTTWYDEFVAMRNGSSDLHNLIAVIMNQDDYNERISTNQYITVPLLTTKKYFRDFENGSYQPGVVRPYIKRLEEYLGVSDSAIKHLRRVVLYWDRASDAEKAKTYQLIRNFFQARSFNNDLYVYFRQNVK